MAKRCFLREKNDKFVLLYLALDSDGFKVLYSTDEPPKGEYIEERKTLRIRPGSDVVVEANDDYMFSALEKQKVFKELKDAWDDRIENEERQSISCDTLLGADFDSTWEPDLWPRFKTFEDYKNWFINGLTECPWGSGACGAIFNMTTGEVETGSLDVKKV